MKEVNFLSIIFLVTLLHVVILSASPNEGPCDPCTEEQFHGHRNGSAQCRAKVRFEHRVLSNCSSYCGPGTQRVQRECILTRKGDNGTCIEFRSMNSSKCRVAAVRLEPQSQDCKVQDCKVHRIIEKTKNLPQAGTTMQLSYKIFLANGKVCDLRPSNGTRLPGRQQTFVSDQICNDLSLDSPERIRLVLVEGLTNSDDTWNADWIRVIMNGNSQQFDSTGLVEYNKYTSFLVHQPDVPQIQSPELSLVAGNDIATLGHAHDVMAEGTETESEAASSDVDEMKVIDDDVTAGAVAENIEEGETGDITEAVNDK